MPPISRLLVACLVVCSAGGTSARADAPRVVAVVPADGDKAVEPTSRTLRVEFDQPMRPDGYSLVGGGPSFPQLLGKPYWIDAKTFATEIRLEPGRSYELSINSGRFRGFRSETGEPAQPHPVRFATRAADPGDRVATLADRNRQALQILRRAFDSDYANRDRAGLDWDAVFRAAEPGLVAAMSAGEFAMGLVGMLAPARDSHLWVRVEGRILPTSLPVLTPNFSRDALRSMVPDVVARSPAIWTGRISDGVLYLRIETWDRGRAAELEPAYAALAEADPKKGLILDLRTNTGGDEVLARQFAGCFLDEPRPYAKHATRTGGAFTPEQRRVVEPNRGRPSFRGKVAVLMGPATYSSGELTLLMMKQVPGCTLLGSRSFGSSSNPQPVDLGNGVAVLLPCWRSMDLDGADIEGRGVAPDREVPWTPDDIAAGRDPVLKAALEVLAEP